MKFFLDDDYILVQETNKEWPKLFDTYFLSPTTRLAQTSTSTTSDDDLVFYVTRKAPIPNDRDVSRCLRQGGA